MPSSGEASFDAAAAAELPLVPALVSGTVASQGRNEASSRRAGCIVAVASVLAASSGLYGRQNHWWGWERQSVDNQGRRLQAGKQKAMKLMPLC